MNEIKLGDKVRSTVSGFEGTATGIAEYLHYTLQVQVTALKPVDGETKIEWFSMSELETVE